MRFSLALREGPKIWASRTVKFTLYKLASKEALIRITARCKDLRQVGERFVRGLALIMTAWLTRFDQCFILSSRWRNSHAKVLKMNTNISLQKKLLSWFILHKNARSDLKSMFFSLTLSLPSRVVTKSRYKAETHQQSDHFEWLFHLLSKTENRYFRTDSYINVWINKVTQMSPNAKTCISERQIWIPVLI